MTQTFHNIFFIIDTVTINFDILMFKFADSIDMNNGIKMLLDDDDQLVTGQTIFAGGRFNLSG